MNEWCAEFGEDKWIAENLTLPAFGFYVDVGAAFPNQASNTWFLRRLGWSGIAIDANPGYAAHWKEPFICAIISPASTVQFDFRDIPTHSRVTDNAPVFAATTLDRILSDTLINGEPVRKVDLLSLDVEGHEYDALTTLNLDKYQPSIIVSEYATHNRENDYRVKQYLHDWGYRLVHTTEANHIFTK